MKESIARKNFYELLGLCRGATDIEIQIAYVDLSRIYDPESRFFADIIDDPISEDQHEVFDLITMAYSTLLDQGKRREYDATLPADT